MAQKRYFIEVRGFDGHYVEAPSAGAARYRDYRAMREAGYARGLSFRGYLAMIETFHHHGPAQPQADREG